MGDKTVSFETAGNHWYWRAADPRDCQTGTIVTMPEEGRVTGVEFKVAGLIYDDPVYGYQNHPGHMRPCIWDRSGNILVQGSYTVLPRSDGGTQPWVYFDLPDIKLTAGKQVVVGFWRDSSSIGYATQWDYNTNATGHTTLTQNLSWCGSGPLPLSVSDTYPDRSLNFRLHYLSGGRAKVWNGSSWTTVPVKVWDGDSWNNADVKVWDGNSWEESGE